MRLYSRSLLLSDLQHQRRRELTLAIITTAIITALLITWAAILADATMPYGKKQDRMPMGQQPAALLVVGPPDALTLTAVAA